MRFTSKTVTVVSCALAAVSASALAVPAQPGDVVNVSGTTVAAEPWLAGTPLNSGVLNVFFIRDEGGNSVFTGELVSQPIRSDDLGTVSIRYQVRNAQNVVGARRVARVEIFGFDGMQTNVDFRTDGEGDIGPNLVSRTNGAGGQVSFLFANPVFSINLDSYSFHIHTNATHFNQQGFAFRGAINLSRNS